MGLFSKKKNKQSAVDVAAAEALRVQQAQAAAAAERERKAAVVRAKKDEDRAVEEDTMVAITAKRREIEQLTRALDGFEAQRKQEMVKAGKARNEKRDAVMRIHLREAAKLKKKLDSTEMQLETKHNQLENLEKALQQKQGVEDMEVFTQNIGKLKIDTTHVEDVLEKKQEAVDNVEDVSYILNADAEQVKSNYDYDDQLAELDAFEADLAQTEAEKIPSVPSTAPNMPAAPQAVGSSSQREEDEIAKLEREMLGA